ncbi:MAG: GreA/GreB family elongation factor [Planctomycetia bacterium]|nr:GreA/GreB family elongation factor [Planctomycetia bacterium]
MKEDVIIMTWPDHAELTQLVEFRRRDRSGMDEMAFERLARELARARLVASEDIPPDVVTMNSRIQVRDLASGEAYTFSLSWPDQADAGNGRVNVLAPLGMAMLGSRVGQAVEWPVPGGLRRLRVEEVLFQPENGSPLAAC